MRIVLVILLIITTSGYAFILTDGDRQKIKSEDDIYELYRDGIIEYPDYLRLLDMWENEAAEMDVSTFKKRGSLRFKFEECPLDDKGIYIYHRLQYQTPRFGFGYLLEPRDRLRKKYVFFRNLCGVENIIVGNYTLRFGQGLVIGNSYKKDKVGELIDLSLYDRFSGVTGRLRINRVVLTPFYSDVCEEEIKGLNTRFDIAKCFNLGGTYYESDVEVFGADFSYKYKFLKFSGETAKVRGKGGGRYLELSYDLKDVSSLASFRDYDPDFYNPHSQSFAQVDDEPDDRDERGFYLESNFKFSKEFNLKTSFDQWSHPERKITDRELTGQIDCKPVSFFNLSARRRIKDENLAGTGGKKVRDYLNAEFLPVRKFEIDIFYGETRDRNSDNEGTIDNFYGTEVKLNMGKNTFRTKAKFSDEERQYYFYAKLKELEQVAISFSFKAVEEIYKVVCDYSW